MGPQKQMKRYGLILLTSALLLLYLGGLSLPDLSGVTLPPPRPLFGQRSLKKSVVDYIESETQDSNTETQPTPYIHEIQSHQEPLFDKQVPHVQAVHKNIKNKPVKQSVIQKPVLPKLVSSQRKQQGLPSKLINTIYKNETLSKKPVLNVAKPVGSVPYHEILKTQPKSKLKPVYNKSGRPGSVGFNRSTKMKPKKPDSLFTFRDMKLSGPYHNTSPPLTYALNTAKTYLNYEFGEKKFPFVPVPRPGITFKEEAANRMDIAEDLKVGTSLKPQQTRHVLIATTWRSGSSFFGSLINSYPGSFYYFEPLHYYSRKNNASLLKSQDKVDFLKTLFACEFDSRNLGFLHHVSQPANRFLFMNHNTRLWRTCSRILPGEVFCFMPDYMKAVCPLYPIKLMKTVRLRVADTRKLLQDSELNMKVIVLVRDPRGVFASRRAKAISEWCKQDDCAKPETSCQNLILDIESARELEAEFPGRILLIRYEDLSLDPVHSVRSVLRFLDLPERKEIMDYIETHTNKDKPKIIRNKMSKKLERKMNPYDLARNSSATAYKWRQSMPWQDIQDIQQTCSDAMDALGYTLLESETQTKSEQLPILLSPNDLWPSEVWQN